ncbi:hypothetical protein MCOR30_009327 [Pyricularia oryzae]|nr:hypothetical protein MCOR30_009327 [Pyricularia oryzae]
MERISINNDERSIAIIGLSCRFPGQAKDLDGFWEMLCRGTSAHSTVPKDRFNVEAFSSGPGGGINTSRTDGGHFLSSDIRRWDANFFGVTADEAIAMDPQQRLMMEVAFEAFENAGVTPPQLDGSSTGVWMGVNSNDWRETLFRDAEAAPLHTWTGTGPEYISGRVSWFFNLRGPSMTVNTACSSSLVALHEARNAILAGDCKMALVGGANLIFNPEYYMYYSNQLFLSPDGRCKSFDASGDGFGRGEGLGAVILKPLKKALEDGDSIRAILRSSGVGQDGWTSGITLPNADAQADLIRAVYADAGLDPRMTGYVEAHGTGTRVGDPAELEAIAKAMGTVGRAKPLLVGSVKTNIGHLEAAAGIAGLVKSILMLENAQLPPTIGIKDPNPKIKWDEWKLQVNQALSPWHQEPGQPRRIGISSFGASGTIAHAIIDEGGKSTNDEHEPPIRPPFHTGPHYQLVTVSAADKDGIRRQAQALEQYLQQWLKRTLPSSQQEAAYLGRLAYTLGTKRADLSYRSFMVVDKIQDPVQLLLEVGPHGALAAPCQNIMSKASVTVPYLSVLSRDKDAVVTSLAAAGELWARGENIRMAAVNQPSLDGGPLQQLIDLPPYQWNHERSYWSESRLTTEHRHRQHAPSRFLGTPLPTLVEGEHLWRALIRPSDEDWLLDHKIQGVIVYPAVGYIAMAVEAARQLAAGTTGQDGSGDSSSPKLRAFHFREVEFLAATTAPGEDQVIEITICVRPAPGSLGTSSDWHHFTISSCTDGKTITKVCTGLFRVEYEPAAGSAEAYELAEADRQVQARLLQARADCRRRENPESFYMELSRIGLEFGPAFRNMSEIWMGKSQSYCTVDVVNPSSKRASDTRRPFIIHPATFDPVLQTITAALGLPSRTPVPTAIEELVISADIPCEVGRRLHVCSNAVPRGNYDILSEICALEEESSRPVMLLRGFKASQLPPSDLVGALEKAHKICGRIEWRPSLELLLSRQEDLRNVILNRINGEGEALNEYMQILCHNFPDVSVLEIGVDPDESLAPKLSLPWHHVLDWETAVCTRDGIQYSSTAGGKDSSDKQVDVVVLRQLPPDGDFGALLTKITDKLDKESPLGFVCITTCIEVAEKALTERNARPLLSIHDPKTEQGLLVFKAAGKEPAPLLSKSRGAAVVLHSNQPSALEADVSRHLQKHLQQIGIDTTASRWEDVANIPANAHVVSLVEVSSAVIETLDEADFAKVKTLVSNTSEILWITSETSESEGIAVRGAVDGFSRSLRSEEARVSFRVAHFGQRVEADAEKMAGVIMRLAMNKTRDHEFRVEVLGDDFVAFTSRVAQEEMLSDYVQKKTGTVSEARVLSHESSKQIPDKDRPVIKLDIAERGRLETLHFVEHQNESLELKEDEVEVQVEASGLNFKDIVIALGRVPGTMEGAEGSGIITRVGSSVAGLHVGDRVVCLCIGMHSSLVRVPSSACRKMPDSMSFAEAASLPVVHCTAYNAFVRIARMDENEARDVRPSVLIHAAAGGLGQVAIQYAQHFGMEVFATVGSAAKRELISRLYGIPDDHVLSSRDTSFAMAVKRMTGQRGVDMVLNSLSGEILRQSWQCLAPGGTFVEVGKAAIDSVRPPGNEVGATYTVFDLEHIVRRNPRLAGRLLDGALHYVRSGLVKPPSPCRVFPIGDVHEAFRLMQTGQHMGKMVFSWSGDTTVPVLKPNPFSVVASMPSQLDADATYLLVGGLGGIGRSISRMLVDMGARKLCFISRSGLSSAPARALVAELQALQCRVTAYACDAADASQLARTIASCQSDSGPVRGVVQCAMVLRDCTFAKMEFSQWSDAVRPKIQASWNLHNILPDLEFFTMLASFAGYFGNTGQSNYGAGCAFQDSLARHRRSLGKPAVALDLGIVNDVGVLAETGLTDNLRDWAPHFGIRERQLQDLIRISILDQLTGRPAIPAQVPTGFASLRAADLAGIRRPVYLDDARFSVLAADGLLESQTASGRRPGRGSSFQHRLEAARVARAGGEVSAIVEEMLTHKVAQSLKVSADEIDPGKSLPSYGINSLVAIEIRNWIFKEIKANVAIFNIIAPVPLSKLVEDIATGLLVSN